MNNFIDWVRFLSESGAFFLGSLLFCAACTGGCKTPPRSWHPDRGEVEYPQVCAGIRDTKSHYIVQEYKY